MGFFSRRAIIKLFSFGALCLAVPKRVWALALRAFPTRTVEERNFRFDPDSRAVVFKDGRSEPYVLEVGGLVEKSLRLDYETLRTLPYTPQTSDFHCVEGWSVPDVPWGGIRLAVLAEMARPAVQAKYVVFHSLGSTNEPSVGLDHYIECLPLAELLRADLECLLALDMAGKPLTHDRGAPLRLVCPFDLAYKSIKFVRRLEFTDTPQDGWWTRADGIYTRDAPVEPSRLRKKDPRTS